MSHFKNFQFRVASWATQCFGSAALFNRKERSFRFLEEALELFQACECSREEALLLVDYVYGRPVGEISQEVGGVSLTLAALCEAQELSYDECSRNELLRVWSKIDSIRAKQAAKQSNSPLPGPDQPGGGL